MATSNNTPAPERVEFIGSHDDSHLILEVGHVYEVDRRIDGRWVKLRGLRARFSADAFRPAP